MKPVRAPLMVKTMMRWRSLRASGLQPERWRWSITGSTAPRRLIDAFDEIRRLGNAGQFVGARARSPARRRSGTPYSSPIRRKTHELLVVVDGAVLVSARCSHRPCASPPARPAAAIAVPCEHPFAPPGSKPAARPSFRRQIDGISLAPPPVSSRAGTGSIDRPADAQHFLDAVHHHADAPVRRRATPPRPCCCSVSSVGGHAEHVGAATPAAAAGCAGSSRPARDAARSALR